MFAFLRKDHQQKRVPYEEEVDDDGLKWQVERPSDHKYEEKKNNGIAVPFLLDW